MKVCIVTEGSREIGLGHITRCVSLCEVFARHGDKVSMVINGDGSVLPAAEVHHPDVFDWLSDRERLFGIVRLSDIVVIDSYLAGLDIYRRVAAEPVCAVYVDDVKRLDYPDGIVLNGAISAERIDYPKRNGIAYLLGARYAFLREAFRGAPVKKVSKKTGKVMVTFGGEDIRLLTAPIIRMITEDFPDIKVSAVIGSGFRNVPDIEALRADGVELHRAPDARAMRSIMESSDIAVSAGGQTLYELASMGLPTVCIGTADNQRTNISGWKEAGFIEFAGWHDEPDIIGNTSSRISDMLSESRRSDLSAAGQRIMDGNSVERIYERLLSFITKTGERLN